jgi:hypothetical protein
MKRAPLESTYGRWTVLRELAPRKNHRLILCRCSCGKEKAVLFVHLREGTSKSCACIRGEQCAARNRGGKLTKGEQ